MDYKEYYTALGKLVYVVAMADGSVQNEEVSRIYNFVISQLMNLEEKTGNVKDSLYAFNTEKEFHRLKKNKASVKETYQQFIIFLETNKNNFDDKMKTTCITLIEKVAIAHNGIEDAEQALIEKVKSCLNEL